MRVMRGADTLSMSEARMDRIGVLILRAWVENWGHGRLRIRITQSIGQGDSSVGIATSADEACAIIQRWISELLDGSDSVLPNS